MTYPLPVVQNEDTVLRTVAEPVPKNEISSERIRRVIERMKSTLADYDDGVALAAPQIGESLRIFVVADSYFEESDDELSNEEKLRQRRDSTYSVFINPKITRRSSKKQTLEEGCLSVRWVYGKTERHEKVTIEALDEHGKKVSRGASGLLAQVFQHEIDHLDGILFIDHAQDLEEIDPKTIVDEKN